MIIATNRELISNQIILDPTYRGITLICEFANQITENGYLNIQL